MYILLVIYFYLFSLHICIVELFWSIKILALVLIVMQVPLEYQQPEWLCCCPTASVEPGTSHQVKPLLIHLFSHLTSTRIFVPCPWWSLTRDVSRKNCPCKEPRVLIFSQAHHVPPLKAKHIEEEPPWFEAWGMIICFSFVQRYITKKFRWQ